MEKVEKNDLIYENEFSRLLATIGKAALRRLQASKILLVGLGGLGIEIAKNIVLMGVASLTVHDPEPVRYYDLSSQFFLSEEDVGKNRAESCKHKLFELNERVQIQVLPQHATLTEELIKSFTVVVLTENHSRDELLRINAICHSHNIGFLAGGVLGLFGWVFADFATFQCLDPDGEPPKTAYIAGITQDKEGVISVVDNKRHDLGDGDVIRITEVRGMTELNGRELKITDKGPYQIGIGDTSQYTPYVSGGFIEQVKVPVEHQFKPLREFFGKNVPGDLIILGDLSKFDRMEKYSWFLQGLLAFQEKIGRLPHPGSEKEAKEVVTLAENLFKEVNSTSSFDETTSKWMTDIAKGAIGVLSPMATIFGGVMGQEIIKASSSKYIPIKQFFFFDSLECLPSTSLTEEDCKPTNTRYDSQIAVFGHQFNTLITNLKYFLVGSGAIGCEMLKCWAMMGVGCGPEGHVDLTDMDTIEISNLNRQFLYRPVHVNQFKSKVAAQAVKTMNPNMNITHWTVRAGPETEDTYNDQFWEKLSGVCNALDNVKARLYIDEKCIFYKKSLLESGTQGTKGNVQVVVPFLTESYGSSIDPPTPETPVCLLHSFPSNIEHCLQWGRELIFEGVFVKEPEITNNYIEKPGYLETLTPNLKLPTLEILDKTINKRLGSFDDCIIWAREIFEEHYVHKIKQLLHNFPLDYVDQHGTPFWSGAKRPPSPIIYDPENPLHLEFMVSATFLKAFTSNIISSELKPIDLEEQIVHIKKYSKSIKVAEFVPKKIKITTDETVTKEEPSEYTDEDEEKAKRILRELLSPQQARDEKKQMNPIVFEKDNDQNFHIDFIHAASNLRASAYGIKTVTRLDSKLIAGKIVPAIVTTTAAVVGFVNLELYKIYAKKPLTDYRNTFMNLALPFFGQAEPLKPAVKKYVNKEFTLWDRIDIRRGDISLKELLKYFEENYSLEIDMLGVGSALIYASWIASKSKDRLPKKLTQIVQEITQKPLPPGRYFMLEPTACDLNGNEIEDLPRVCYWYK